MGINQFFAIVLQPVMQFLRLLTVRSRKYSRFSKRDMRVFRSIQDYKNWRNEISSSSKLGFVPTMGFLHEGHLSLVRNSVQENDYTVVSIFVNPVQFNNKEDLEKYPRNEPRDIVMLEEAGCDIIFMPSADEMYPEEITESYSFPALDDVMEGAFRPGHFNGVAVVVARLFRIILPHISYFGKKDYQQYMIIKELARQQFPDLIIKGMETIREKDGLAMSSRNVRLSEEERENADMIFQLMTRAKKLKEEFSPAEIEKHIANMLVNAGFAKVEYIQISDADTLEPVHQWKDSSKPRIFIAAWLGNVRLIDNMELI